MAENRIHVIIKNNDSMNPVLVEREMQMAELKKLPIGIEDFEKIRQEDFYYVDKTRLIEQFLNTMGSSKFFYTSKTIWKILEYEYVSAFL